LTILPSISNENVEIFHYSNEGNCSWYDFAIAIFELKELNCKVNPIPTKMYPTPAKRPNYSLLSKSKIKETYKIEIANWRDSLKNVLIKI
jgi:dTDP-4-dehydrorhamnose reductase